MLTKILEMGACLIEKGIHLEFVTTAARETQIKEFDWIVLNWLLPDYKMEEVYIGKNCKATVSTWIVFRNYNWNCQGVRVFVKQQNVGIQNDWKVIDGMTLRPQGYR